jgi:hypothetical protein
LPVSDSDVAWLIRERSDRVGRRISRKSMAFLKCHGPGA